MNIPGVNELLLDPSYRIDTSNRVSRLHWFGSDEVGILPILIGMKEAKVAAFRLSAAADRLWRQKLKIKRDQKFSINTGLLVLNLMMFIIIKCLL